MRALKICLWVSGFVWLLSAVVLFMPFSVIKTFSTFMGVSSFPDSMLILYGLRVALAIDAGIGFFYIILALDPMDYGIMVPFSGAASLTLGIVCAILGYWVKMPTLWVLGDALGCSVIGVLILVFWWRCRLGSNELILA